MTSYDPNSLFGHGIRLSELEKKYNKIIKTIQYKIETHYHSEINRKIIELQNKLGEFDKIKAVNFVEMAEIIYELKEKELMKNNENVIYTNIEINRKGIKRLNEHWTRQQEQLDSLERKYNILSKHVNSCYVLCVSDNILITDLEEKYKDLMLEWNGCENDHDQLEQKIEMLEKSLKALGGWRDCKECYLYGECDHQGAYQKDGKWCYEDLGGDKMLEEITELIERWKKR